MGRAGDRHGVTISFPIALVSAPGRRFVVEAGEVGKGALGGIELGLDATRLQGLANSCPDCTYDAREKMSC